MFGWAIAPEHEKAVVALIVLAVCVVLFPYAVLCGGYVFSSTPSPPYVGVNRAQDSAWTRGHSRGWCTGVCENQGLIPGNDFLGECLCGTHPAYEFPSTESESGLASAEPFSE